MNRSSPTSQVQIAFWLLLLAATSLLALRDFHSHSAIQIDSSRYVVLAQSLLHGPVYGLIDRPVPPPVSVYPFGYPLILAPLVAAFPQDFEVLRWPSLVATLLNISILFWGWRLLSKRSQWWGLAVAALYAVAPSTILQARLVLSEAVFMTFLLVTILLFELGTRREAPGWWCLLAGASSFAMVFTRTAGWPMWVGLVLYLLVRRRRRALRDLVGVAAAMGALITLVVVATPVRPIDLLPLTYLGLDDSLLTIPSGEGQTPALLPTAPTTTGPTATVPKADTQPSSDQNGPVAGRWRMLADLSQAMIGRVEDKVTRLIPTAVAPGLDSHLFSTVIQRFGLESAATWAGLALSLLMLVGFAVWTWQDGVSAFLVVVPFYGVVLMMWAWSDVRFLYPIAPQMVLAFLIAIDAGIKVLWRLLRRQRPDSYVGRLLAPVALMLLVVYAGIAFKYPNNRFYTRTVEERGRWLRERTPPESLLMTTLPETDYLYTGRSVLPLTEVDAETTPVELWLQLQASGADFAVVYPLHIWWREGDQSIEREFFTLGSERIAPRLLEELAIEGRVERMPTPAGAPFQVYALSP